MTVQPSNTAHPAQPCHPLSGVSDLARATQTSLNLASSPSAPSLRLVTQVKWQLGAPATP